MKPILILMMALFAFSATAQEKKNKNAKYTFEVKGNCEQCKKRIEKAAFGVGGVKMAMWNQDAQQLTILLNEEKGSVSDVKKAVAKAGHDTDGVKASDADYDNLHHCCKYERE